MADATDSKSVTPWGVRVQVPPPVPDFKSFYKVTFDTAEARRLIPSGCGSLTRFW